MRIARVDTFVVEQQLDRPFFFSQWDYATRHICLVRITADDGTYGWGEGYGPAAVIAAGIRTLAPLMIGRNPLAQKAIWQDLRRRTLDYARSGALVAAVSAIDVALWDLKGKALEQPVSVLLGGPRRGAVSVYATGMYFSDGGNLPERLAAEAAEYVRQGFRAVKMKVGLSIGEDIENVTAVREAIGDRPLLMVDANHAYSRAEARRLANALEPLDIGWFEEPLSPDDYDGYRELRALTSIPLAGGECEYLCTGFRRLFSNGCVDVAQPDICAAGGLTEIQGIVAMANAFGVNVTPHCWGTGIAFAAALHLVSSLEWYPGRMQAPDRAWKWTAPKTPCGTRSQRPDFRPSTATSASPMPRGSASMSTPTCSQPTP